MTNQQKRASQPAVRSQVLCKVARCWRRAFLAACVLPESFRFVTTYAIQCAEFYSAVGWSCSFCVVAQSSLNNTTLPKVSFPLVSLTASSSLCTYSGTSQVYMQLTLLFPCALCVLLPNCTFSPHFSFSSSGLPTRFCNAGLVFTLC